MSNNNKGEYFLSYLQNKYFTLFFFLKKKKNLSFLTTMFYNINSTMIYY